MSVRDLLVVILGAGATAALVSGLFQIILWRLNRKATVEDRENHTEKYIKDALCLLLHDKIQYLGTKFIDREYITPEELQLLIKMHECYHDDLGGNGLLDNIMTQVKALPIRKKIKPS